MENCSYSGTGELSSPDDKNVAENWEMYQRIVTVEREESHFRLDSVNICRHISAGNIRETQEFTEKGDIICFRFLFIEEFCHIPVWEAPWRKTRALLDTNGINPSLCRLFGHFVALNFVENEKILLVAILTLEMNFDSDYGENMPQ